MLKESIVVMNKQGIITQLWPHPQFHRAFSSLLANCFNFIVLVHCSHQSHFHTHNQACSKCFTKNVREELVEYIEAIEPYFSGENYFSCQSIRNWTNEHAYWLQL